ncbi:MAG: CRTAC1 family protein [Candidatus Latescibacterota bacterium]
MKRLLSLPLAALLGACSGGDVPAPAPPDYARIQPSEYARVGTQSSPPRAVFTDITAQAGLDFVHQNGAAGAKWMPETMGSGCALLDWDGDEDLDALLVNGRTWDGGGGPCLRLYRNDGHGAFSDVTAQAGLHASAYGMGVTAADYDADGDADVYLTCLGDNVLLRNDGGRFTDVTAPAGVAGGHWTDEGGRAHPEWSTGAAWVDVDRDGWLDLFVTNYVQWSPESDIFTTLDGTTKSYATPQPYDGATCRLYRNLGNGRFTEVTREAGLYLPHAKSMGVAVADFDDDGWPDLVVTNDTQPNFLLRNRTDGAFEERGLAAGIGYDEAGRARAGMGVDVASLDPDPVALAIAIGNFSRQAVSLYEQTGGGSFLDAAGRRHLVQPTLPTLTFGLRFLDWDLDGRQDLVLANGHIEPEINRVQREVHYQQPPQLFWNDGEGHLVDVSDLVGGPFATPMVARGLATGDIDLDGDVDLLLSTNAGPAHLLRNDGPVGHGITVRLRGRPPNREALGAVVTAEAPGVRQGQMVRTGSSYLSHSAPVVHVGLGQARRVERLAVRWPDGQEEVLTALAADRHYWIEQGRGVVRARDFAVSTATGPAGEAEEMRL